MNKELIEYQWDEYTGQTLLVYKDVHTAEITEERRFQGNVYPILDNEQTYEKARSNYWVNVIWFIRTQGGFNE